MAPTEHPRLPHMPEPPAPAVDHKQRGHHRHGMSKLPYLDLCAGFQSQAGENEAAQDGTRLHEILDRAAIVWRWQQGETLREATLRVLEEPDVVFNEDEEGPLLEDCCYQVDEFVRKFGPPKRVLNEIRVTIWNEDGTELNYGSLDLLLSWDLSDGSGEWAVLFDWKFGWIPVQHAQDNLQGMGYAVGVLQRYAPIQRVHPVFVQPKLNRVSVGTVEREDVPALYSRIREVIDRAKSPKKLLRPGKQCDVCAVRGTCSALLETSRRAVTQVETLPLAAGIFTGDIEAFTPEQVVVAYYCVQRLKKMIEDSGLTDRIKELALASEDGHLEYQPPGTDVVLRVEVGERAAPRSASNPAEIAEVLEDVLTPEQVLACCDPSLGKLETAYADTLVDRQQREVERLMKEAEAEAAKLPTKKEQKAFLAARKKELRGVCPTKKEAKEHMSQVLESHGLVSRPDGRVTYVKLHVDKLAPEQISQ